MDDEQQQLHTEQKRMGAFMLTIMWILFLIILMFFFDGFLKEQHNPNQVTNAYTDSDDFKEVRLQRRVIVKCGVWHPQAASCF